MSQFIEMFGEANNMCSSVFSDFVTLKAGKSKKVDEIQSEKSAGLYPCFGGNGIRGYVNDYTHDGEYCIIGRQGALCGNVQVVKGKFYATEHAVVVTPKAKLNTIWLFYSLTQMNLNQYARGVAQPGLAVNQLEKLAFCIPQLESQRKFAAIAIQSDKSKFVIQKALVYLNNSQRVELSKIA
jgi:type I restriction enzyme S subunit|uniref:restriction endonuclease subunit S n=1 Tax=Bacteroides cellulosilyticus TaxID=246787 RepID=UPI004025D984